ncbi:peptidase M16 inactive domain protein [Ehrlichia chaffeensis str. Heartland]|uniref:Peptidase, M16 family n=1 Tax=Ehrlichia chaffeensis (strain ATCC CRL-10679 / Arkansas) TaxID=205920 RepID=Q2GFE1_EHRCR|nr:pitrilysin family protein [Ehrlichia chaffeensis]ABD45468.1 peptidase, M16 family [Ehrlichia chaffeensis str. Arkansas]AHX03292.1 peptidase M16 inactive domain protein [Ehrlichia chaffeensis str. Heartland]AHX05209.1 peptidase M16 inactive domain protein [Ehrlichia chaffeensis str. Jax]AHX06198.1 peptidase M16 inactive domain protein [Ehrlichia chaffeensis str. Liberty]AHX07256.1 peptidase M16 inactive domain protein [Ehrlichia chaffeensis str. Osceola]
MVKFFTCFFTIFFTIANHALSFNIKVTHEKLDNGMEVYVIPNHRAPAVMHMVLYKVGGTDDPVGYSGLAHFFEHLMFSGTEKFPNLITTLSDIGGNFNASTSEFCTIYYELIPKQHLSLAMDIESDRMQNFKITDKALIREQKVVLEERKMRVESQAKNILQEEMENTFYYNGYGRPVVGWEHEISNYNREVAEAFYKLHYSPNNAILVVTGDVDPQETINLAQQYYGKIEPNHKKSTRVFRAEPSHKANITLTLEDSSVEIPELFLMYQIPSGIANKNYILNMMAAEILGNGKFSLLYNDLVMNNSIVTSIGTNYNYLTDSDNYLFIEAVPKDGISTETVEKEIHKCINSYLENGISPEYLESAKQKVKAHLTYSLDGLSFISYFYGMNLILGVPLSEINNIYDTIDKIKIEDIDSTMENIFLKNVRLAGHLLPKLGE